MVYVYNEMGYDEPQEITEEEILLRYWDFWHLRMVDKFGVNSPEITEDNCIIDWVVVNWAWVKE